MASTRVGVSDRLLRVVGEPTPDYCAAWALPVDLADCRSAEHWAQAILPRLMRGLLIRSATPEALLLERSSRVMRAYYLVSTSSGELMLATAIRFTHPLARMVWALARPIHEAAMPRRLLSAVREEMATR